MQLTVEQLEILSRHLSTAVRGDIAALGAQLRALEQSTQREFSMVHGRIGGVADAVHALDQRINGRISRSEDSMSKLGERVAGLEAESEAEDKQRALARPAQESEADPPYITRREFRASRETLAFLAAAFLGLLEVWHWIRPFLPGGADAGVPKP